MVTSGTSSVSPSNPPLIGSSSQFECVHVPCSLSDRRRIAGQVANIDSLEGEFCYLVPQLSQ
jgi:hypothetical protein